MSILHTLISSKAMALGALFQDSPLWPRDTTLAVHDISVGRQSLISLASERGTPCVLIAPSGGLEQGDEHRTVVIATILACTPRSGRLHPMELRLDCDLQALDSRVLDTLLPQRPHASRRRATLLHSSNEQTTIRACLPETSRPGELVALTCVGTIALGQVTPHHTRDSAENDDDEQWLGRCLK